MAVLNFPPNPAFGDTYTENNIIYTWNGTYWQANSGSSLDDFYVKLTGDTMTGDLTLPGGGAATEALQKQEVEALIAAIPPGNGLWQENAGAVEPVTATNSVDIGSGNVYLNAADGSIVASGDATCGPYSAGSTTASGAVLQATGAVKVQRIAAEVPYKRTIRNFYGDTETYAVQADGTVVVGGDLTSVSAPEANITLDASDGSGIFGTAGAPSSSNNLAGARINTGGKGSLTAYNGSISLYGVDNEIATTQSRKVWIGARSDNPYDYYLRIGDEASSFKFTVQASTGNMIVAGTSTFGNLVTINNRLLIERTSGTCVQTTNGGATRSTLSNSGTFINYDPSGVEMCKLASDGSTTFAGDMLIGDYANQNGISLRAEGLGIWKRGSSDAVAVTNLNVNANTYGFACGTLDSEGNTTYNALINKDGSGIFNEYLRVRQDSNSANALAVTQNGTANSDSTFRVNGDGSCQIGGNPTNSGSVESGVIFLPGSTKSVFATGADSPAITVKTEGNTNVKMTIYGNGDATFAGTVTATVVPPSDIRFKENITPANSQLDDVVALGKLLKNYDWNDEAPVNEDLRKQRQLGLIAQEVETVCPGLVKDLGTKENSYKGISTDALIMKLLGAITEQNARIEALEAARA